MNGGVEPENRLSTWVTVWTYPQPLAFLINPQLSQLFFLIRHKWSCKWQLSTSLSAEMLCMIPESFQEVRWFRRESSCLCSVLFLPTQKWKVVGFLNNFFPYPKKKELIRTWCDKDLLPLTHSSLDHYCASKLKSDFSLATCSGERGPRAQEQCSDGPPLSQPH